MPGGGLGSASAMLSTTLPVVPILIPLAVHFLLVCFVLLLTVDVWLPLTYLFSHLVLILVGLWAVQDKAAILPVISMLSQLGSTVLFMVVVIMTVLLDIIQLGLYYDDTDDFTDEVGFPSKYRRTWQFSAAMMIINLLGKPVTIALSCIALYARAGGEGLNKFMGGNQDDSYTVIHDGQQQQ